MSKTQSGRRVWTRYLFPSRPYTVLLLVITLGMVLFSAFRFFFLTNFISFVEHEPLSEIVSAFAIGLRFDLIVVLITLVPLLLFLPWINLKHRSVRIITVAYLAVVLSVYSILVLADIRFYHFFDSHLNFLAVEYIGDGSMFQNLILTDPMFYLYTALWIGLSLLILTVVVLIVKGTRRVTHRKSWLHQLVYFLVFAALFVIGIRGRVSLAPIDWGAAYFSQNHFLNQLALNGLYTLGRNLNETNNDPRLTNLSEKERFPFVARQEGYAAMQTLLGGDSAVWMSEGDNPMMRKERQPERFDFHPNVVIVVMESWTAQNTGSLGGIHKLSPNFDSLASEGILFTNFYANGARTNYGLGASLCSFPALPGRSILKRYDANHPFRAISEILKERDYYNAFVYGGDLMFDNMEGFFRVKRYDRFYGDRDFPEEEEFSKWGVPDHLMFHHAAEIADSLPRPFQLTLLTLSNHDPFELPDSTVRRFFDSADSSRAFNAQLYADKALGKFMREMRMKPSFDSTVFVFVADHARIDNSRLPLDPSFFHIPLLIYSPSLLPESPVRVEKYGSQVDIVPTLMGILGGSYTHASWGRNLLALPETDSGFAVLNLAERLAYLDNTCLYIENLGREPLFLRNWSGDYFKVVVDEQSSGALERVQTILRTYAQIAEQLTTPTVE